VHCCNFRFHQIQRQSYALSRIGLTCGMRPFADLSRKYSGRRARLSNRMGAAPKMLSNWLKANPRVGVEDAERFIRNKFESDEPRGAPPWEWLPRLSRYCEGPLDRYGRVWRPDWRAGYEGLAGRTAMP
jgi:hypothetical protein